MSLFKQRRKIFHFVPHLKFLNTLAM